MRGVPDPYRELGVSRAATDDQVKAAHRRLAKRFHPDAAEGDQARFLAVQEAYLLLADPIRRRDWDSRHAPGPVRATERPVMPRSDAPTRGTTSGGEPQVRRPTARPGGGAPPPMRASGRDPGVRSTTWSAQGVPWWEDFRADGVTRGSGPSSGSSRPGAGAASATKDRAPGAQTQSSAPGAQTQSGVPGVQAPNGAPGAQAPNSAPGAQAPNSAPGAQAPNSAPGAGDVYSRSSGAAWSSAARRHFRKDDADLPRGGAFRYRGTQVVTGAEARQDAAAEARRATRSATSGRPAGPSAPHPAPVPAAESSSGLRSRLRKLLGGSSG